MTTAERTPGRGNAPGATPEARRAATDRARTQSRTAAPVPSGLGTDGHSSCELHPGAADVPASAPEQAAKARPQTQPVSAAAPAPGAVQVQGPSELRTRSDLAASDAYKALRGHAELLNDYQQMRIGVSNRVKRSFDPGLHKAQVEKIKELEEDLAGILVAQYRKTVSPSIRTWQKATPGLGEHLLARLLGHLGDPRVAMPYRWMAAPPESHVCGPTCGEDRHLQPLTPYQRSVSQLWSYCGLGDPARKRRSGMSAEEAAATGSPRLKSLMFLIAESCVKQNGVEDKNGRRRARSPYRGLYEEARTRYADRVHAAPCHRCGPSGRPAPAGSPWSGKHQQAAALRIVAKRILRDLWLAAGVDGHIGIETHRADAVPPATNPLPDEPGQPRCETQRTAAGPSGNGSRGRGPANGRAKPSVLPPG